MQRHRLLVAALLFATFAFGLATRTSSLPWPNFVSQNFGDALWAIAVYLLLAFLVPAARPMALFFAALVISFSVEFSQLATFPWLVDARSTLVGKLLLGRGFIWVDLFRYTVGIIVIFIGDFLVTQHYQKNQIIADI